LVTARTDDVPEIAIEVNDLTKRFGDIVAVRGITLSVPHGIVFGLVGPNGAGKSTTVKMLTTLTPPTSGMARVAGFDVRRAPVEVRRRIGYVPQMQSADPDLTGFENLLVYARLYALPRHNRRQRILDALHLMDLDGARDRLARHYSGGMVRRLEIAQSLLNEPRVLFMDEPTIGLDPLARHMVWERVKHLRSELGTTIFMTTHYMDEAAELCDRVAFMSLGTIAGEEPPGEIERKYGPGVTLDDLFIRYTGGNIVTEEHAAAQ
jgi:ABC-2 type transport system ATP-binding protein